MPTDLIDRKTGKPLFHLDSPEDPINADEEEKRFNKFIEYNYNRVQTRKKREARELRIALFSIILWLSITILLSKYLTGETFNATITFGTYAIYYLVLQTFNPKKNKKRR